MPPTFLLFLGFAALALLAPVILVAAVVFAFGPATKPYAVRALLAGLLGGALGIVGYVFLRWAYAIPADELSVAAWYPVIAAPFALFVCAAASLSLIRRSRSA